MGEIALTPKQSAVLDILRRHSGEGALPPSEIARYASTGRRKPLPRYYARDTLVALEVRGLVERAGWADRERCWRPLPTIIEEA